MRDDGSVESGSSASVWQARVKTATALLVFFQLLALMLGCGFLFIYFIRHAFYPGALTVADTFGLLFLAFGFTVVWLASITYATVSGYPLARLALFLYAKVVRSTRFSWKPDLAPIFISGMFCLVSFWGAGYATHSRPAQLVLFGLLCYGALASFLIFGRIAPAPSGVPPVRGDSAFDRWFARRSDTGRAYTVVVLTATALLGLWFSAFQDIAMLASGFRKQSVSIQLDKADFVRVSERAAQLGLAINPCEMIETDVYVLDRADILWYQAGTRSLLRFPSVPLTPFAPVNTLAFQYESTKPVVNVMPALQTGQRCDELPADLLFAPGMPSMRAHAATLLGERLAWLADEARGRRIRITVHGSDVGHGKNASRVTLAQSKQVAQWLARNIAQGATAIEVAGMEATLPKLSCKALEGRALKRCEAANRRVEIRILEPD